MNYTEFTTFAAAIVATLEERIRSFGSFGMHRYSDVADDWRVIDAEFPDRLSGVPTADQERLWRYFRHIRRTVNGYLVETEHQPFVDYYSMIERLSGLFLVGKYLISECESSDRLIFEGYQELVDALVEGDDDY